MLKKHLMPNYDAQSKEQSAWRREQSALRVLFFHPLAVCFLERQKKIT